MSLSKQIECMFFAIISFIGAYGVYFLKDLSSELSSMNTKMAVVLQNLSQNEFQLRDHEDRLRTIEKHK